MSDPNKSFLEATNPFALFSDWMAEAHSAEPNDPNAMSVATIDGAGLPDVRVLLLKGFDERGFVFYTNEGSAKGGQLAGQPKAALNFHWKSLRRQVRVRGPVSQVTNAEADAYFATRSRVSQIGAWSSKQSQAFSGENDLAEAVAENKIKFAEGDVPRPPFWKGYRVTPLYIEFWHDQPFRLHDRIVFRREECDGAFVKERLFP